VKIAPQFVEGHSAEFDRRRPHTVARGVDLVQVHANFGDWPAASGRGRAAGEDRAAYG